MSSLPPSELRHVLLVGPPGSGNGTVGPYLSELLGVPHVSSGQLLRAAVNDGDQHHIGEQVARGHLVPDRVVAQVMTEHLGDGFILDGYPRNVRQAAELDRVLSDDGRRAPGHLQARGGGAARPLRRPGAPRERLRRSGRGVPARRARPVVAPQGRAGEPGLIRPEVGAGG